MSQLRCHFSFFKIARKVLNPPNEPIILSRCLRSNRLLLQIQLRLRIRLQFQFQAHFPTFRLRVARTAPLKLRLEYGEMSLRRVFIALRMLRPKRWLSLPPVPGGYMHQVAIRPMEEIPPRTRDFFFPKIAARHGNKSAPAVTEMPSTME